MALRGVLGQAKGTRGLPLLARIQRRHAGGAGWPGFAGMEPEAAAGARVGAGLVLWLANKLAAMLALLHGSLRVQRTHARGRLVTGASPATSPCGGASRLR